jgi:hypothetical protein
MRFLLVSTDQPSVKKVIDIPDRLVSKKLHKSKKTHNKSKKLEKAKHAGSKTKKVHTTQMEPINKPNQISKSIIGKHGSVHHSYQRKLTK